MGQTIRFTVPAIPIAQPRQRQRVVHVGGRAIAQNYTPKSDPVNAFKATVAHAAAAVFCGAPLDCPVSIACLFVFPRPKSLTWKTKPMPRVLHTGKPDVDNVFKALTDALNGIVFIDDSRIYSATIQKVIAAGDEQPHCEVEIAAEHPSGPLVAAAAE